MLENTEVCQIKYDQGCLVCDPLDSEWEHKDIGLVWDKRSHEFKAPAHKYKDILLAFIEHKVPFQDEAKAYKKISFKPKKNIVPREHQKKALSAWVQGERRGVISLPTGAGKTILAIMSMIETSRSTLIIVPTIDLLNQWRQVLSEFFEDPIGALGGGSHEILPITVSTYDSGQKYAEKLGNQFGLIIFDECHRFPSELYQNIAFSSIAPFRLGLSATLERSDGREEILFQLVGPLLYSCSITEMTSDVLAPYDIIQKEVELTDEERQVYQDNRNEYLTFIKKNGIDFRSIDGWKQFIIKAARSPEGRLALKAYYVQKRIAQAATGKLHTIWNIINAHVSESIIIFTDDNPMAYHIGCEFILPVITHKTKIKDRKNILDEFRRGTLKVLVTSKVLNEGVDVPKASVAVVVSGSGTVREHVQRLGRVLRNEPGKRATLYEIVSKNTGEQYVNQRRRQHIAYQRSS